MSQSNKDGLIIDNSVLVIDEKKPGFPLSARIYQILAIIIGSWSAISVLIESIEVPVDILYINMAVLITTGIMLVLCLLPSYDVVKQFFGALFYVLFFWSRLQRIKNGFYIVENLVLDRISSYYEYPSIQYKADYSAATTDTTLLFIMLLIPIVALLTVSIVRSHYITLSSFLVFLPVAASFLFGKIPSERYLIALIIAVLYLTRSGFSSRHTANKDQQVLLHRISSRVAVWLSFMGVVLFFLMKLIVTPQEYDDASKIMEMKTQVQSTLYDFSIDEFTKGLTDFSFFGRTISTGGLSGGDLGKTGQVKYTNTEQLRLSAPMLSVTEGIYLKGYVGSVYTGDNWAGHSKTAAKEYQELLKTISIEKFPVVNQVGLLINHIVGKFPYTLGTTSNPSNEEYGIYQGAMKIEYKAANEKFLYAPYFTDYELLKDMKYEQDLYAAPSVQKDSYEVNYFFNISMGTSIGSFYNNLPEKLGDYTELEKLYRRYVYQVYTELPEEGLERLKEDFSETREKTVSNSIAERIEYVKKYLYQNTQYSLSPGKLPKGADFVEFFLYENKVGYCAHYASAATLMLRAMGIPARYVEGYAVGSMDIDQGELGGEQEINYYSNDEDSVYYMPQVEVTVKDYNAHAWVEVYMDSCGWIPVEFTPGSAVEYDTEVMEDMALIGENLKQDEKEDLKNNEKEVEPEEPTPTPEDPEKQPTDPKQDDKSDKTTKDSKKNTIQIDTWYFVMIIVVLAFVPLLHLIKRIRKRRKVRYTKNRNKKALYRYVEIEKILASCHCLPKKKARLEDSEEYVKENCSYIDINVFEGCMENVHKARFGAGKITPEELQEVEQFRQNLYDKVYQTLPLSKKIYLKFILFI